jgi:hypothetical protein
VEVSPARLPGWLSEFARRHGAPSTEVVGTAIRLLAPDGATAELAAPLGAPVPASLDELVDAAGQQRRLGLLLARQAAVAVGIADGPRLVASKVDTSYVQGRTAAGGWSQQRFARRRDNQAKAAVAEAIGIVVALLLSQAHRLAAVVTGGDRRTVAAILADPRLAPLAALRADRFLDVSAPRLAALERAAIQAHTVLIKVMEPG